MAVTLEKERTLPRANVRDPECPFPDRQYVRIPNVAVFSEHETKTPAGEPQTFDREALQSLVDRGNERIRQSGDYAAVCIGHTHDPEDGAGEQPEVIGAAGPFRLGLLGQPGAKQRYVILADFWIRRDRVDQYNAHPRRSVELWYERDKPAWIDPISLLTEAPRLDLGLTPLIPPDAGSDGAEMKYLYAANFGGLRRVKYAAACASAGNVFVPVEEPETKRYAVGGSPETPQSTEENTMLSPEDIKQIVDAIEQLDVIVAMKDFAPSIPKLKELLAIEELEHQDELQPETQPNPTEDATPLPEGQEPPAAPTTALPEPPEPPEKIPEDLEKVNHSADAVTDPKPEEKATPNVNLDDMDEDEIERYLCARRAKYAAGTADGKPSDAPSPGTVDPPASPSEGSAAGDSQSAEKAKYSAMESRLRELESDRIQRANESRKEKLRTLRYHRTFGLDKEIERCTYDKMSDDQFRSHLEFIAEVAAPTCANSPMPVPDELLDSKQPPSAVRVQPERYSKENCDEAARVVYERRQSGKSVSYETVLDCIINGRPVPE